MINVKKKRIAYLKRKRRVRKKIKGTPERPRLTVYKSNRHIYAQIIDDTAGRTLEAFSTLSKELRAAKDLPKGKCEVAKRVGVLLAKRAVGKGIKKVVFDRNGFLYHGRIKAIADGAREGGLEF